MEKMPKGSVPSAGKVMSSSTLAGRMRLLMADQGSAWAVSSSYSFRRGVERGVQYSVPGHTNSYTEDFTLLEIYYTVVRLIQVFSNITVPADEPLVEVGKVRQIPTLVVSCADGCRVHMKP